MNVLLLMLTLGAIVGGGLVALGAWLTGRKQAAVRISAGLALWLGAYATLLGIASLNSAPRMLERGEALRFCGFYLDCHLSAQVENAKQVMREGGVEWDVVVRMSNDAERATIPYDLRSTVGGEVVQLRGRLGPLETRLHRVSFRASPGSAAILELEEGFWLDRLLEGLLIGDEDSLGYARTCFRLT